MAETEDTVGTGSESEDRKSHNGCTVVGIGASAGGINALKSFFQSMPADSGMAFVVIVHLAHDYQSNLSGILQSSTSMPVTEVTETLRVEPNHVYVIPPGKYLEMVDGEIRVTERTEVRGTRVPIDMFLRTLAEAYGRRAICVILSGSGSDGTLGLKRVKEAGGIAIAQDPEDAEYDSMPRSAIGTALVDLVLPASEIPRRLITLNRSGEKLERDGEKVSEEDKGSVEAEAVREITTMLRVRTAHDFSNYKRPTVLRRIARRVQVHGLDNIVDYVEFLRRHPDEIEALLSDLLITVTDFFRDKEAFEALQNTVIPKLFSGKTSADQVRVWVVGCATGEEAYSIAILLREHAMKLSDPPMIQVFASDINDQAIATARECRYTETMTADISPERLRQFFVKEGNTYLVKKEIREMILFAPHNVTRDPPFSRIDLLSCRNLLIYLNRDMQERILEIFHFSLRREGFLFLGASESAESAPTLFSVFDKKWRIYRARPSATPHPTFPIMPTPGKWQVRLPETSAAPRERVSAVGELHFKALEMYGPPSVLVDENGDIVHFSQHAGRYFHVVGGEPTTNLLKIIQPDLHMDCRTALFAARQESGPSHANNLKMMLDGQERNINLTVQPVGHSDETGRSFFLVLFEERDISIEEPSTPSVSVQEALAGDRALDNVVRRLEEELEHTRDRLRTTIEQYETSIEELRASNEELQAINEELRSASEELETGKEELQSVNEELTTVNHELKEKVDKVSRANSDLQNFMSATDIGTIFLDRGLNIRRYTPAVQRIFNVISTDIGRPLEHLTHSLDYQTLTADATEVLRTLQPMQREVQSGAERWYIARIAPYRTLEDRIDGVVLTFVDISDRRLMEQALRDVRDRFEAATVGARDGVWDWNVATDEVFLSKQIYDWLDYSTEDFPSGFHREQWEELVHPLDRQMVFEQSWRFNDHESYDIEFRLRRKSGSYLWVNARGRAIMDGSGRPQRISGTLRDITDRKRMDEVLRESDRRKDEFLATLSHELRNPLAPMSGALEIMKSAEDRETQVRARQVLEHQVGHLIRMVDDLLDISRITLGKLGLRKSRLDLSSIIELATETCRPLIDAAHHRLRVVLPPESLYVDGDTSRLAQALANIVNNAVKYTPPGGDITITVAREGDEAVIRVRDTGSGIPAEDLPRVFEIFEQGHETQTRALGGLGIGLNLVRRLVEMHGGVVTAASDGPGTGSEFTMRLPMAPGPAISARPEAKQETLKMTPQRILVVDDNAHAVEILAKLLALEGHTVETAPSGGAAIEKAAAFKPSVVCLDINLPDANGYEVAAQIKRDMPGACIIAISGWLENEHGGHKNAVDYYLLKPVEFQELRAIIAGVNIADE